MTADQEQFTVLEELEAAEGLQGLIDAVAEGVPPSKTGRARTAEIVQAISESDIDELIGLQEKLESIIERIMANKITPEDTGLLTPAELYDLMVERLDQADVEKLLKIRYQMIRHRVFTHIAEDNRRQGITDPEHAPGEAAVPVLKKRFTREGGKARATLDHEKLHAKLGEQRWNQVCRTEVIPEHVEYHLDEDALLDLVRKDPKVLDLFRDCIIFGGYGQVRFHIRDMTG